MSGLEESLKEIASFNIERGMLSMHGFVLEHGRRFAPSPLPARYGRPLGNRLCFANSWRMARKHGLTYVEGFAISVMPVLHAWNVDHEGRVLDFTWPQEVASDYYGIEFSTAFVLRYHSTHQRSVCLLDDWQNEWPIISGKYRPEEWR
jgi:hypothetical protein